MHLYFPKIPSILAKQCLLSFCLSGIFNLLWYFFFIVDKADKHEEFKEMMSFEDRCLQKIRESNLTVLRESVEEQVAKISDR